MLLATRDASVQNADRTPAVDLERVSVLEAPHRSGAAGPRVPIFPIKSA